MSILNLLNPRDNPEMFRPFRIRDNFDPNTPFGKFINTTSKVFDPIGNTSFTPANLFLTLPQAMSGNPLALAGIGIEALRAFVPEDTFEQRMMRDFYDQQFGLDNIGRIQSGIMKGYSPVYGRSGGAGLGPAIDRRIDTIRKTLARKYGDANYKGPKTKLDERVEKLLELKQQEEERRESVAKGLQDYGRRVGTLGYQAAESSPGKGDGYSRDFMEGPSDRPGGGGYGGGADLSSTMGSFRYGGLASL
tara:strand:- start:1250 stop:1993 length:744 start_codon:yes stop_codon:yes gene_type:complete